MPSLKIPDRYRAGFTNIIGLTDESAVELLSALADVSPVVVHNSPQQLVAYVAAKVPSIPEADLNSILRTLVSLYIARADREATVPDFVEDICQAIEKGPDGQLRLSKDNRESFKQRLIQLLGFDALNVGSKAVDVSHEYEHVLCSLRILTDIRPVFGDAIETPPTAGVITHTLKVVYHHGNVLKEFFVALDTKQIAILRKALARAEAKATSLKSVLDKAGVHYLEKEHTE